MYHQSLNGQWSFRQSAAPEWMPATVPGGVHTDLLALGKIPDPFVADNEKQVQWIGETARVTAPLPAGWTVARARKALQVRSLIDSYR